VKDVTDSEHLGIYTPLRLATCGSLVRRGFIKGWIILLAKKISIPAKEERNV
jgi:hypothetical protein